MTDSTKEENIASASYTLTFYQDIMSLTEWRSIYKNYNLDLAYKYLGGQASKLKVEQQAEGLAKTDDQEKAQLRQIIQNVRYFIDKTVLMYQAIVASLGLQEQETQRIARMKEITARIDQSHFLLDEDLSLLLLELHTFLLKDIVKGLLKTSQSYVEEVFGK